MRLRLALLAFAALSVPVRAQDAYWQRFFPLAIGNAWEYDRTQNLCFPGSGGRMYCQVYRWTQVYAVTGTEARGDTLTYTVDVSWSQGAPAGPYAYRTRWVYADGGVKLSGFQGGDPEWPRSADLSVPAGAYDYRNSYVVTALPPEGFLAGTSGEGKRYTDGRGALDVVAGIGPVRDGVLQAGPSTQQYYFRVLRYARVGGVEVGQRAVAAEAEVGQASGWTVHPNPASGSATLRLGAPATVEVVDVIGRRVRRIEAGPGEAAVDLGGLAPGVYVVRAAGQTRTLVVR